MSAIKLLTLAMLIQISVPALAQEFKLEFGLIIQNEYGEPVGFEQTTEIPIKNSSAGSLYGLVVTSPQDKYFSLNSVHSLPKPEGGEAPQKIIGKTMIIQNRGAIFLRTDDEDIPGMYSMEVYIDNKLHTVIQYELKNSYLARK